MIQWMLAIWSLVPLPFLKPALTSGSSRSTYCWSLAWRILSITLLACEMSATVQWFERSLALPFFGIGIKTDLFQSWVFQICWHIECSTFTASSFRIWNSSTGIPSPPLALFVVMLPKAYLTSCYSSVKVFNLGDSKITADGDWSHEINRCLLLGRKVTTNLDSILKSRDITFPANVHLTLSAMVFPVVMYGYES